MGRARAAWIRQNRGFCRIGFAAIITRLSKVDAGRIHFVGRELGNALPARYELRCRTVRAQVYGRWRFASAQAAERCRVRQVAERVKFKIQQLPHFL